ncbi:85/88 kDa calcium-independent phospholipase A2 [Hypsibius exemplaris]|uniref:phospholipase A2 n=1 Tax=Hypsibius exemplaris TaxID=2072580 RepID=A0A1W0WF85_HYPEX|nr:85/88 kDa calcium-independent phospholipase A2 [Hypsibius exemplaris]
MDYIRSFPSLFRNPKRQMELILPFTYNVLASSEAELSSCSLCKMSPPFAVYGKPVGDKAPSSTTATDPNAVKASTLSMLYELVLITPKEKLVFSIFRSPSQEKVIEEMAYLFPVVHELSLLQTEVPDLWSLITVKNVCSFIASNKDWPAAHVAAFFGWEIWNENAFARNLDLPNPANGEVPLHVAIKRGHLNIITKLLDMNCRLDIVSNLGDSIFHYAATADVEIIKELGKKKSIMVNSINHDGQSPLLLACMAAKQDCIEMLLSIGADLSQNNFVPALSGPSSKSLQMQCAEAMCKVYSDHLDSTAIKFGGTPLHWCKTKAGVLKFMACKVNIESRNDIGETPLHLQVMRSRLDCSIVLLSHGANIQVVDFKGNTPLHVAVIYGSLEIVKCMIVFGASITAANLAKETALSIADSCVLSKRRDEMLLALSIANRGDRSPILKPYRDQLRTEMRKHGQLPDENLPTGLEFLDEKGTFSPTCVEENKTLLDESITILDPKRKLRVLCLDGGGIKGLVLIELLMAIEEMMDRPLKECFDWIAGTSTGASVALAVATGKSMKDVMGLYFRMKDKIFIGSRPYPAEAFETILQEEFGAETKMTDITGPKLLIPALLVDRHPPGLHFFRNYDHPIRPNHVESIATKSGPKVLTKPSEPKDQLVWRAARASGAAPTYFRSVESFLDGGLMANNPTLDTLTEIFDYNSYLKQQGRKDEVEEVLSVLSLGTGRQPMISVPSIDVYWPEKIWDAAKIGLNASALSRLIIEQACQSEGRVVDRARAWCESHSIPFFRFSPQFSREIHLDCVHDETLIEMLWETRAYIESENVKLRRLATLLKQRNGS